MRRLVNLSVLLEVIVRDQYDGESFTDYQRFVDETARKRLIEAVRADNRIDVSSVRVQNG